MLRIYLSPFRVISFTFCRRASISGSAKPDPPHTTPPLHIQGQLDPALSKAISPPINSAEIQIMSALLFVSGEKVVVELHV